MNKRGLLDLLLAWEDGALDLAGEVDMFNQLIRTRQLGQMQGKYGRRLAYLLDSGLVEGTPTGVALVEQVEE